MTKIKFRLRTGDHIVGYEKWYPGDRKNFIASPCWLYSKSGKTWTSTYIWHVHKDQYIGIQDKKGTDIYRGDNLKIKNGVQNPVTGIVIFLPEHASFSLDMGDGEYHQIFHQFEMEIIERVQDDPELLKCPQ